MSTRLTHDLTYDAPLADVAAMLADVSFREAVCDAQGAITRSASVTPPGGGPDGAKEVAIEQVLPTEGVPSFAKKIVGDTTTIQQHEAWRDAAHGDVSVTIPGKPGEMAGTATLVEADGVTTETVDLTITVKIPVVGGKIEKLIADILRSALKAENRTGRTYLADQSG